VGQWDVSDGYNPFDPGLIEDPYPAYAELLAGPILAPAMLPAAWVVSKWSLVRQVLGDRSFSADRNRATLAEMVTGTGDPELDRKLEFFDRLLLTIDPPDHARLRRLVSRAFTPRRVDELADRVGVIADGLAAAMDDGVGECDLVGAFAYPLPVLVIAELLGLPAADREDLKRWSDDVALLLDPFPSTEAVARFGESIGQFRDYLDHQFDHRRRHPADDLIGALVAARDGDDALSDDELFALVVLLVAAGHETTTNLIGNAVIALTRHPD
jgi:cytochrome P450